MPEQVWYRTKLTQSSIFLVQYRAKIRHVGMPMPVLVSSMPMPSYVAKKCKRKKNLSWAIIACTEIYVPPVQSLVCVQLSHVTHSQPNPPEL
jgi:hypothetical protein